MKIRQSGFTLVEIAIVLVIIGLLFGGILKGQELINSARVRSLSDSNTGIQAAYYGFVDRFRRIPGDWNATNASLAIGVPVSAGGNDDGQINNVTGPSLYTEPNAIWVQLAAAGFIQGSYNGGTDAPTNANGVSPLNPFNNVMVMGRTDDYLDAPSMRLQLVIGRGVPVDVIRELDLKTDDANPYTGEFRAALPIGGGAVFGDIAMTEADCVDIDNRVWDVTQDAQNCNGVSLF